MDKTAVIRRLLQKIQDGIHQSIPVHSKKTAILGWKVMNLLGMTLPL